jgi:flagellar hook assembly protein FlgD
MFLASATGVPRSTRPLVLIAAVMAAIFVVSFTSLGATTHASSAAGTFVAAATSGAKANVTTAAVHKKAVIVVGPVGADTAGYIVYAKAIAASLEKSPDIDVTLILPPHATWSAVVSAATGADFFAYIGHGNGWPSNMPPAQEDGKDGFGLNPTDGDTNTYHVQYYGANYFIGGTRCSVGVPVATNKTDCTAAHGIWKNYGAGIQLAPNAIVLFNHVCFSSGNSSTETTLPTDDIAFQRVDNFAYAFLAIGAKVVFALGWQPGEDLTDAMVSKHMTADGFFEWKDGQGSDPQYQPWHGWIGWKPADYHDSTRTPGAVVHLDPHPTEGYLRGVTGDLSFTFDQWWAGGSTSDDTTPPTLTALSAGSTNTTPAGDDPTPVFTPNGDGLSDSLTIKHTLSEPSYLDVSIARESGTVVRHFTTYSDEGATTDLWDGTNDTGSLVSDGTYTITITPKDRAGNVGDAVSTSAKVLTAMRSLKAAPNQFYAKDNDALAQTQTQKVTLDKPANLTWVVKNSAGDVVRTAMTDEPHDVGLLSWTWDGKSDAGAYVPDGAYTMSITATTSLGAYTHEVRVLVSPFKLTAPVTSVTAGQKVVFTLVTAEAQQGWPKLTVTQPGLAKYTVSLAKYTANKFTATITFKSGGTPGTVLIKVSGTDVNGGANSANFTVTIH